MMNKPFQLRKLGLGALMLAVLTVSCKQDVTMPDDYLIDEDAQTTARAAYGTRSVDFNNRTHGSTYSNSWVQTDFGDNWGWNASRTYISNGTLRVTLIANAIGGGSGMTANVNLPQADNYEVSYQLRFHSAFEWSRGGKLGFGLLIGDGNTGCDAAFDGNGGSARLMWYQNDNGRVYLQPYLYYRDQQSNCGDTFGLSYPATGSLVKGTWYNVTIRVRSNTGSNTDGNIQYIVNGTTVLDKKIRWTTNTAKRLINALSFHSFRGGSQSYWQSGSVGYIYYDNVKWGPIGSTGSSGGGSTGVSQAPVGQVITLKGSNNLFVSGENGEDPMWCDRPVADAWEQFTVVDAGNGKVALQSMGKYLSSENGEKPITCNRTSIGDWERFDWVPASGGGFALRGNNGMYISSEDGTKAMTCTRASIDDWETFTL